MFQLIAALPSISRPHTISQTADVHFLNTNLPHHPRAFFLPVDLTNFLLQDNPIAVEDTSHLAGKATDVCLSVPCSGSASVHPFWPSHGADAALCLILPLLRVGRRRLSVTSNKPLLPSKKSVLFSILLRAGVQQLCDGIFRKNAIHSDDRT